MDHASRMDVSKDALQAREKNGGDLLSPTDWLCRDKFHGKGEAVDPFHRTRYLVDPSKAGIDPPFFPNEPKSHCPPGEEAFPLDILDHEFPISHLHLKQIRFPERTSPQRNETFCDILSSHLEPR